MRFPFGLTPKKEDETGPRYADLYPRAVAAAIDLSVLFLVLNDMFHVVSMRLFQLVDRAMVAGIHNGMPLSEVVNVLWASQFAPIWLLNMLFQVVIIGALLVATQIIWGTTAGKWLLGLKIVRAGNHEAISSWRYILRFLGYLLAVAPLMLGIIWMSFNRERRGWHDYIAGTVVLNTRGYGWYKQKFKACYAWLKQRIQTKASGAVK